MSGLAVLDVAPVVAGGSVAGMNEMIAAGSLHSVVLRSDGTVRTFGYNPFGELGTPLDSSAIVAVGYLTGCMCWGSRMQLAA